jgi:hypothetical protein
MKVTVAIATLGALPVPAFIIVLLVYIGPEALFVLLFGCWCSHLINFPAIPHNPLMITAKLIQIAAIKTMSLTITSIQSINKDNAYYSTYSPTCYHPDCTCVCDCIAHIIFPS